MAKDTQHTYKLEEWIVSPDMCEKHIVFDNQTATTSLLKTRQYIAERLGTIVNNKFHTDAYPHIGKEIFVGYFLYGIQIVLLFYIREE